VGLILQEREADPKQVLPARRRVGRRRLLNGGDDGPGEEDLISELKKRTEAK
jgi:hypothetical protein